MALHGITLSAKESSWQLFMVRKADPAFLAFQEKIFKRDQHTCQFCGFRSKLAMDAVNLDGNYRHNRMRNMVTSCPFCTQCFFLEAIGRSDFGGGSLILLPEMTQGELSALCHVLFHAQITDGKHAQQAKTISRSLKLRSQPVEKELGEGMSNPSIYGQMLIDSNAKNKMELNAELSEKLRVLPSMVRYAPLLEAWALEGIKELTR